MFIILKRESIEQLIKENASSGSNSNAHYSPIMNNTANNSNNNSEHSHGKFTSKIVENEYYKQQQLNASSSSQSNPFQTNILADSSSMVSLLLAAAAQQQNPLNFQPSIQKSSNQSQQMSNALLAAYKYNELMLNQQQQQASLAKFMSMYYNKPMDYMQSLLSNNKDQCGNMSFDSSAMTSTTTNEQLATLLTGNLSYLNKMGQNPNRYHPYLINNKCERSQQNQHQEITISTMIT